MSDVNRYRPGIYFDAPIMIDDAAGCYVEYDDYQTLASRLEELQKAWREDIAAREDGRRIAVEERQGVINDYARRLDEIKTSLNFVLVRNQEDKITAGDAMNEMHEVFYQHFQRRDVETLTVRVSDEELAELNRNAIARGQAPLTPVVENLPTWCPKCNAVMAHVPHQCGVVETSAPNSAEGFVDACEDALKRF